MSGGKETDAMVATSSQTVGPFFHFALTADSVVTAVQPPAHLPRLELTVRVTDGREQPIDDAAIEIFYAAEAGAPLLFARLPTVANGTCRFTVARPVASAAPDGNRAAAHVNVCVFARGLLRHLHTRIYFDGDPDLAADAVLALVPEERRKTLLARETAPAQWAFDLRLQGSNETAFFDV